MLIVPVIGTCVGLATIISLLMFLSRPGTPGQNQDDVGELPTTLGIASFELTIIAGDGTSLVGETRLSRTIAAVAPSKITTTANLRIFLTKNCMINYYFYQFDLVLKPCQCRRRLLAQPDQKHREPDF